MKVSIDWLREYIDFECPIKELADGLTMAGLEVEEIANLSKVDFADAGGGGLKDDTIFDVKVTPNRGDWLSMIGVAREAAHLVGSKMRLPLADVKGSYPPSSEMVKISIQDADLCKRYVGIVVRNVEIKDSPGWLKDRIIAAGMRPINNVVDITNYVMMELGQPLHAFDYKLLKGQEIIVRRAKPGETIVSIDGVERKLSEDVLVIADAERPVALAGVMGGFESEINKQTQDILIESANFNSVSIRRTAKKLGMLTESSYRFERGVDPAIAELAALRAAQLVHELAGGEVADGVVDVYPEHIKPLEVKVRPERVNSMLGTSIAAEDMVEYLDSLEIETSLKDGVLICNVPTFRQDITREIDLVEEVGRVYGYDKLNTTLPNISAQGKDSREGKFREKIRRILMSCSLQEVITHSLVDSKLADMAGRPDICLKIRNPLTEDLDAMRVMLIPNLLQVIARNQAYGTSNVSVSEIGKVYFNSDGVIGERLSIAGAIVGSLWGSSWSLPPKALDADYFSCKGVIESLLQGIGIHFAEYINVKDSMLHPTRSAKVMVGDTEIGLLGEVSPELREAFDLRGRPCVFELDFQALMNLAPEILRHKELPRYPAMYRHLAVVVENDVKYGDLVGIVEGSGEGIVEKVELLDVYKDGQIGVNKRSLTISIVFRSQAKTLTDEEVNAILANVKEALEQRVSASFR